MTNLQTNMGTHNVKVAVELDAATIAMDMVTLEVMMIQKHNVRLVKVEENVEFVMVQEKLDIKRY